MALQAALGGPRHSADPGFEPRLLRKSKKYNGFVHISENDNFDTPISFFFFGFLSLCYGRGDAAGSTTLTRNRPRHLRLSKEVQCITYISWCIRIVCVRVINSRITSLIVAGLQEAFLFTSALGFICGRKCQSANKVLLIVHTSFSVILTWMH